MRISVRKDCLAYSPDDGDRTGFEILIKDLASTLPIKKKEKSKVKYKEYSL